MISFPFNSEITSYTEEGYPVYDRAVDASVMRKLFNETFNNGIYPNIPTCLQVVENSGMKVTVKAGACLINGAIGYEELDRTLNVEASDTKDRIDRVIARLNDNKESRKIELYIIKGTPSGSPQPPELTRNESVYDLCIADLYINANTQDIKQTKITDTRLNTELCGVVTVLTKVDTTDIFNQYNDALDQFLGVVESAINETLFGQLMEEINDLKKSTIKTITISPSNWSGGVYQLNDSLITATSNQDILPPLANGANTEMIKAIQKANLCDGGQGDGWLKIRCLGKVPTIPVTLRIIYRGGK